MCLPNEETSSLHDSWADTEHRPAWGTCYTRQWHRCLFLPCFPDPEINGVLFLFLPIKDIGDIKEMISQIGGEVNKSENVNTLLCELEGPSCYNRRLVTISLCNNISDGWCGTWIWEGKHSFVILGFAKFHWRWCLYRVMSCKCTMRANTNWYQRPVKHHNTKQSRFNCMLNVSFLPNIDGFAMSCPTMLS